MAAGTFADELCLRLGKVRVLNMLRISQIRCGIDERFTADHIGRKLRCMPADIRGFEIERESLDARGEELFYTYTVLADVRNESRYLKRKDVAEGRKEVYRLPEAPVSFERPVIAGYGPAGMLAGLILAECGMAPIIIERGRPVEERTGDVERFFREGILDPESNVQYGEGGAGTFSDGKLTARNRSILVGKVLEEFVEAGADPAVMYQAMPHIGTDRLRLIVKHIREKTIRLGGEIRFSEKLEGLRIEQGRLTGAVTDKGVIDCSTVLLCLGHSAHETYRKLYEQGVFMSQKDFAAGVRVEHPQELIDRNQYGRYYGHPALGAASYRLTHKSANGRGVYSFCMCPGGIVIPSSSEEGGLVVNGMSYAARDGRNANSAILVQIPRRDFDRGHPLDGFAWQRKLEEKAYREGFRAPLQNIADYIGGKVSSEAAIPSSYPRGTFFCDMESLFPEAAAASLKEGLLAFDRKIPGFVSGIMVGMESRSSSVIRLDRGTEGESLSAAGVFPCGEGAGYAGGIVSSAADGIRQAENVIAWYRGRHVK